MSFSLLAEVVAPIISLGSLLYLAGGQKEILTQTVKRIDGHDEQLKDHHERIEVHAMEIERLKWWKEGFNTGANKAMQSDEQNKK